MSLKEWFKPIFKKVLRTALSCMKVHIHGLENLKDLKKGVYICNHVSGLDVMNLFAFLPNNPVFAISRKSLTLPLARWAMRYADVIDFDHLNPDSVNKVVETVKSGRFCLIFAENQITSTGALMKIYDAPGIIADRADAPLIPIWIHGARHGYFSHLRGKIPVRPMPTTHIYILPPKYYKIDSKENRDLVSHDIYQVMLEAGFEAWFEPNQSLFKNIMKTAKVYGKNGWFKRRMVVIDMERKWRSFKDLLIASFVLARKFNGFTKKGEHVGVMLPNGIACLSTILALSAYKRVVAMLNYTFGEDNMLSTCQTALIKTVITSRKFIDFLKGEHFIKGFEENGIKVVYLEDIKKEISIKDKIAGFWLYKRKHVPNPCGGEEKAFILFTTGSEGKPKAVVLSHNNIIANVHQLAPLIPMNSDDMNFNTLPMFHSFGLTASTLFPLICGARLFLYPTPLHYRIIPELCYEYRATLLFGTDTFLKNYAKVAHPYDFNSLKYVVAGAESLKQDTIRMWFEKFGIRMLQGYGATEASPVVSINTPIMWRADSVGQLLPAIKHRIIKVEGVEKGGELSIQGPNLMMGYYLPDNPGVLVPPKDGWYNTGDVVEIDQHGYVTIKDRIKRFAKMGGEMVSLSVVESLARNAYSGLEFDCAAVAIPHDSKGEQIVLVASNDTLELDSMSKYAKEHNISLLCIPRVIMYMEEIPTAGSGKKDFIKIKKIVLSKMRG